MGTRWTGLLLPAGVSTGPGDDRKFLPEGVTTRELPMPLKWQREDKEGHEDSIIIGLCDQVEIKEDGVWGAGELFDDVDPTKLGRLLEDVNEAKFLLEKKVIGPSVDNGSVEVVMVRKGETEPLGGDELMEAWDEEFETGSRVTEALFTKYEIAAATLVTVPAFAQCRPFELQAVEVALTAAVRSSGWDTFPLAARDLEWTGPDAEKRIAEDAGIGTDNPDWERYKEAFLHQDDAANPETKGAYGFQIVDIVDGERQIMPRAVFTVAGVLQGSMGGTNIPDQEQQQMKGVVGQLYERMAKEWEDNTVIAPWEAAHAAIVAAMCAKNTKPVFPREAFTRIPEPGGLVPITVGKDGSVFGHIATHDVCHIGIPGVCTTAPIDDAGFAQFHRYQLPGDDGQPIDVGRITFGAGKHTKACSCCVGSDDHACSHLSMGGAIAHHDQMMPVAYVKASEDETNNAIWISGTINPEASEDQIRALSRGKVSGDWRANRGTLALVEVLTLSREKPGFPLPRARMNANQMITLTAAGTISALKLAADPGIDYDKLSTMIATKLSAALTPELKIDHSPEAIELLGQILAPIATKLASEVTNIASVHSTNR